MSYCGRCGSTIASCSCEVCEDCGRFAGACMCDSLSPEWGNFDTPEQNEIARALIAQIDAQP